MNQRRIEAYFSGTVQGVGFRYTSRELAKRFSSVTGYVRNLSDGRVELVAEGDDDELDLLLRAIQDSLSGCIRQTRTDRRPATGEFQDFSIQPTR